MPAETTTEETTIRRIGTLGGALVALGLLAFGTPEAFAHGDHTSNSGHYRSAPNPAMSCSGTDCGLFVAGVLSVNKPELGTRGPVRNLGPALDACAPPRRAGGTTHTYVQWRDGSGSPFAAQNTRRCAAGTFHASDRNESHTSETWWHQPPPAWSTWQNPTWSIRTVNGATWSTGNNRGFTIDSNGQVKSVNRYNYRSTRYRLKLRVTAKRFGHSDDSDPLYTADFQLEVRVDSSLPRLTGLTLTSQEGGTAFRLGWDPATADAVEYSLGLRTIGGNGRPTGRIYWGDPQQTGSTGGSGSSSVLSCASAFPNAYNGYELYQRDSKGRLTSRPRYHFYIRARFSNGTKQEDKGLWSHTGNVPEHPEGNADRPFDPGVPATICGFTHSGATTPLVLERARVNNSGTSLELSFNRNLDGLAVNAPRLSAFTVVADGVDLRIDQYRVSGETARLTIHPPVLQGQSVVVSYDDPTSGNDPQAVQDTRGNDAQSFRRHTATNGSTQQRAGPMLTSAGPGYGFGGSPQSNSLDLTFNEALSTRLPRTRDFQLFFDGRVAELDLPGDAFDIENQTTLSVFYLDEDSHTARRVRVIYTDPTSGNDLNAIQNTSGDDASSFCVEFGTEITGWRYCQGPLPRAQNVVEAEEKETHTTRSTGAADFTARFVDMPATHDGKADIVFELRFNQNLATNFSYTTLRDHAFTITNGTVKAVERIVKTGAEKNQRWTITVDPTTAGQNVVISLAATTNCSAEGAICNADNQPLTTGVSRTVAPQPQEEERADLTVAYTTQPPAEHDGSTPFTFAFSFSENLATGFSYTTIRDHALSVTQGGTSLTPNVSRKVQGAGNDQHWVVTVTPSGRGDISISLSASASCGSEGAICTDDDRALSNGLAAKTVKGPPGLSVADTDATEGTDANMTFTVTLSRAASAQVTVNYATSDGTATAGTDYTATAGTLTFAVGETSKTVEVPILTDTVNDDGETFTLTLSNPSGGNAYLADATATATIANSGGMPQAWITRFGRTVASQVVDAVGARMEGGGGNHVQVGGFALNSPAGAVLDDEGPRLDPDHLSESLAKQTLGMSGRDLLLASAFNLTTGGETGGPTFGAWGRVGVGHFEAEDDGLVLDGEVTTGFLGADIGRDRWLAGVALSFSEGDSEFAGIEGDHAGTVESSLTSLYPYARVGISDRVSAWGLVGAGSGELPLEHGQGDRERTEITTDIAMRMGALGVRGEILASTEPGWLAIALKSDAFWVQTESDEVRSANGHLMAAEGEATRVRLIVEATGAHETGDGTLTPSTEIGVRHDGGDAETGTGLEVGGALRYERGGFAIEGSARTLVAHEARGYEEWGAAGTVRIDPGASGRGLSLMIAPSIGAAGSGIEGLWAARDARALAPAERFRAGRRLDGEVGYGLPLGRRLVGTSRVGFSTSEYGQAYRIGYGVAVLDRESLNFDLGVDAQRRESSMLGGADTGFFGRATLGW